MTKALLDEPTDSMIEAAKNVLFDRKLVDTFSIRDALIAAAASAPQEPVVDDDAEWLLPYRSMGGAGSPEAAACVGRKWIEDIAEAVRRKSGGPAMLQISSYGAGVTTLYQRNELLAVTTAFRDEMNFTVLVRWLCDRLQAKAPETGEE